MSRYRTEPDILVPATRSNLESGKLGDPEGCALTLAAEDFIFNSIGMTTEVMADADPFQPSRVRSLWHEGDRTHWAYWKSIDTNEWGPAVNILTANDTTRNEMLKLWPVDGKHWFRLTEHQSRPTQTTKRKPMHRLTDEERQIVKENLFWVTEGDWTQAQLAKYILDEYGIEVQQASISQMINPRTRVRKPMRAKAVRYQAVTDEDKAA